MRIVAVLLLTFETVSASAQYYSSQYRMVIRTIDGLAYPFNVERVDSVYFELFQSEVNGNDEDETTVTGNATDITNYTASISSWANILDNLSTDLKVGIIYTQEGTPSKSNGTQKTVSTSSLGSDAKYTIQLTDLAPSTTYYYRSFVYQSGIWFYGNVKSFTTKGQGVELVSGEVTKLTCYSAKLSGAVSIDESTQYRTLTYGICYSTDSTPTVNSTRLQASSKDQDGNFAVQLRALTGSTTYYYRSYAYVDNYLSYGPIRSFTTKDDDVVITGVIDTITYSVKSTLKIGNGAYSTLELGVCYGTKSIPTVSDMTVTTNEVDDENNFTLSLKDIPFGTVYYRSFVKIDGVAHYGEIKEFTGNEITTGDIDSTYSVISHININHNFYTKNVTYGVCYGNNVTPTVNDMTVTTKKVDADNNFTLTLNSIPLGTVYYRSFVKIDDVAHYGVINSFNHTMPIGVAVDLGLSVKWATFNVGAYKPEDYGYYYAWGETETKTDYNWSTYKYANGDYGLTKYCNKIEYGNNGYTDSRTKLELSDDVARQKWGGSWRLPTEAEQYELCKSCTWTWYRSGNTEFNGVAGYKVTSKKSGYTDRFIFLPAAGYRNDTYLNNVGSYGFYWSSSLYTGYPINAYYLDFGSDDVHWRDYRRYSGFSVRPVCP